LFLARDPSSVRHARRVVVSELQNDCSEDVVDRARVLVSELVTNALVHGQGTVFLCIVRGRRRVRAEVGDDGPPLSGLVADEGGGFGARLLEKLADAWGIESTRGDGKKVWFEIAEPPGDPGS